MLLNILCDAIPFCYGPAAALIALVEALGRDAQASYSFDVLATASTRELLVRSDLPVNLLEVDSDSRKALGSLDTKKYDAFINVCNPLSFEVLNSPRLRTIYVDFLLWMHEGPPPEHFAADLYLAENYPGTEEWVRARGSDIENLRVVSPLIKPAQYNPTKGRLLMGLGGLLSSLTPLSSAVRYSSFVVACLLNALKGKRFNNTVVACGEAVAKILREQFNEPGLRFESFSHDRFIDELSSAEAFVSHPGLYAVFEAMLGGVPTAMLPPSNYTQVLQLRHYRHIGLADYSFAWEDQGLAPIPSGLPEAEGVRLTIEQIKEAREDVSCAAELRLMLSTFFDLGATALRELGQRHRSISSQFGYNGPTEAAVVIKNWLWAA